MSRSSAKTMEVSIAVMIIVGLCIEEVSAASSQSLSDAALSAVSADLGAQEAPQGGAPPSISVGDDAACDYIANAGNDGLGLQQAIDAAAVDSNGADETEVRLANTGEFSGRAIFINDDTGGDQTLRLVGGFSSCADSSPTSTSTIDSEGLFSVVSIVEAGDSQTITMRNLVLQGGGGPSGLNGGGLSIENNNVVLLYNVTVQGNSAQTGGGIHIEGQADGTDTVLLGVDLVTVEENEATGDGGGIYCSGPDVVLGMDARSGIWLNSAENGGGLAAVDGCSANIFSVIGHNEASGNGGGVLVDSGATFQLIGGAGGLGFGDPDERAVIGGNQAQGQGGGVHVAGAASSVGATDAWIGGNLSLGLSGGGVAVRNGGTFEMDRTLPGRACHERYRCSRLADNGAANSGGAVWISGPESSANINQTHISGNAAGSAGTAVFLSNLGGDAARPATLSMEGNIIHGNETGLDEGAFTAVIDGQHNSEMIIAFTTFADNLVDSGGRDIIVFDDTSVEVYSSIFSESSGDVFHATWDADTSGSIDCALVFEQGSLPNTGVTIVSGDPIFKNPGKDDYRLQRQSPAVDFCDTFFYTPSHRDVEGQDRGRDEESIADEFGPYDLGADEFFADVIFSDRFEDS